MCAVLLRKSIGVAVALMAIATGARAVADGSTACPVGVFGEWNGRTYYYCRAGYGGNACGGALTGASDTQPHALDCDTNGVCNSPITLADEGEFLRFYGEVHSTGDTLDYQSDSFNPADDQCHVLATLDTVVAVPTATGTDNRPIRIHYVVSNRVKTTVNGIDQLVPVIAAQQSKKDVSAPTARARRKGNSVPLIKFNVNGKDFKPNDDVVSEDPRYKRIVELLQKEGVTVPVVAMILP